MQVRLIISHPTGWAKYELPESALPGSLLQVRDVAHTPPNTQWYELLRNVKRGDFVRIRIPESFKIPKHRMNNSITDENQNCRLQINNVELDVTSYQPCLYIQATACDLALSLARDWEVL